MAKLLTCRGSRRHILSSLERGHRHVAQSKVSKVASNARQHFLGPDNNPRHADDHHAPTYSTHRRSSALLKARCAGRPTSWQREGQYRFFPRHGGLKTRGKTGADRNDTWATRVPGSLVALIPRQDNINRYQIPIPQPRRDHLGFITSSTRPNTSHSCSQLGRHLLARLLTLSFPACIQQTAQSQQTLLPSGKEERDSTQAQEDDCPPPFLPKECFKEPIP